MTIHEGQQLGNYRLLRLLGVGGFAEVYLGEHIYLTTQAAIKVLQTQLAEDEREHFLNEARIIARLAHPHIVRVLEFGVEKELPFLVMDYAPNGNLRQRLPRGIPLSAATIVPYIEQVAAALDYAHAQHLVHRDVKPENMLLGNNEQVLLSDFGIALIAQSARLQNTQEVFGTASYMAPEQIQGKAQPASDQYALGMVMYEWLCGDVPFHGSFTELCSQHLFATVPPLREKIPGISPAIEAVVERTLSKEPGDRFPSVQAMVSAFVEACWPQKSSTSEIEPTIRRPAISVTEPDDGAAYAPTHYVEAPILPATRPAASSPIGPTQAVPEPTPQLPVLPSLPPRISPEKRRISRRNIVLAGAAIVGVAAAGGLIWRSISPGKPSSPIPVSVKNFTAPPSPTTSSQSPGSTLLIYSGHTRAVYTLSWSPNGQYISSGSADATVRVWNISTGNTLYTYHGHVGLLNSVYCVGWAANGQRIASGGTDKTVQISDAATGNTALIYHGHTDRVLAVSWSPNARDIASGGTDKTVQVWKASTGTPIYIYHGHTGTVYTATWSPGGKSIASGSADKTVQVWDATTGTPVYTYKGHAATVYALTWSPDGRYIASAGADRTVQVWEVATGKQIYTYHGHSGLGNAVSAVAWSPDGKRIASGGTDKTVQVWDALNGKNVYTYTKHTDSVFVVEWSPDGLYIASGSADATVRIWRAS